MFNSVTMQEEWKSSERIDQALKTVIYLDPLPSEGDV